MVRLSEAMYVVRPDLPDEEMAAVLQRAAEAVSQAGGTVQLNEIYEKRALAYEIDGCVRGTYCLMYFEAEGDTAGALKHELDLDEQVLRHLIVIANPRAIWRPGVGIAPMGAHAEKSEEEAEEAAAEAEAEEAPEPEGESAGAEPEEAPEAEEEPDEAEEAEEPEGPEAPADES